MIAPRPASPADAVADFLVAFWVRHPVTGIAHNPKDDHKILQAWGHDYDKARGQEHRSPVRAAKHEKDKARRQKRAS